MSQLYFAKLSCDSSVYGSGLGSGTKRRSVRVSELEMVPMPHQNICLFVCHSHIWKVSPPSCQEYPVLLPLTPEKKKTSRCFIRKSPSSFATNLLEMDDQCPRGCHQHDLKKCPDISSQIYNSAAAITAVKRPDISSGSDTAGKCPDVLLKRVDPSSRTTSANKRPAVSLKTSSGFIAYTCCDAVTSARQLANQRPPFNTASPSPPAMKVM